MSNIKYVGTNRQFGLWPYCRLGSGIIFLTSYEVVTKSSAPFFPETTIYTVTMKLEPELGSTDTQWSTCRANPCRLETYSSPPPALLSVC